MDKQFGKDFEHPQYWKMVRKLKKDDLLYIKSTHLLGWNYSEILEQWQIMVKEICSAEYVLEQRLDGCIFSDIVLQVLSCVAENERISIRQQ